MKAVVLEIRDDQAAVLLKGGTVERIKNRGYVVGQQIELPKKKNILYSGAFRTIAVAAALLLVFVGVGGIYFRNIKECAYVTVDVNPSIEYAMNAKCKVVGVKALNEDAENIVQSLKENGVKGEKLENALESTKEVLYETGYLGEEKDNVMLLSVVTDDESMRGDLKQAAETVAAEEEIAVYVVDATISERKEAEELGISTGRYEVTRQVQDTEEAADEVKTGKASVKELVETGKLTQVSAETAVAAKIAAAEKVTPVTATPTLTPRPTEEKPVPTAEPTAVEVRPTEKPAATATPKPKRPTVSAAVATPTALPTATATPTERPQIGPTATPTPTEAPTATPTSKPTATPTPKPTATPTPRPQIGPTATPTPKPTATPTPRPQIGPTATPTPTEAPTATPTQIPTETPTPTADPTTVPTMGVEEPPVPSNGQVSGNETPVAE